MQLTEQFHIPDEYTDACDRLTTLVEHHAGRLLVDEYWTATHIAGVTSHSGQSYTYIRDDVYDAFNGVDEYLYSRFKRCVYQRVTSVLEAHADEYQAFQFVTETVEQRKIKTIGWEKLRDRLFTEDSPYLQWGILESVVEQLNNYYDCHGAFPDCYTDMVETPEPNGTLPYAPDKGDHHIHQVTIENGHLQATLNAPNSLTPDSYLDWSDHKITFPVHSRLANMLEHGAMGAPTLHKSECGYTLDVPVEIPEQDTETIDNRVLSVDLGVKKQTTAVVVDGDKGQVAPPEIIDHPNKQKLFRLTTEAEGINDRLAALRKQGKAHTDRFNHLHSEYEHLRRKETCLRTQIQHDVANQLVWLAIHYECETIVFESLGQIESPDVDGTLAHSISTWARGDLLELAEYKAELVGVEVESVNPWGTSRYCPRCGERGETVKAPDDHTECRHGGHFHCPGCGYECDRDVVGAINVGRKYLSDSKMEAAKPVAYTETGNHASFPSPVVDGDTGARSTGVQSTAHKQKQDSARSRQTRLTQYCTTVRSGVSEMGGLHQNHSSNTGRQLPSGSVSITQHVLASAIESD
ncbi:RNA-guided endonuclease InsQ/TnpB family protein [Natronoarchaeum sp. GCM10025703]|uniref:RNA-guided endonuclease InsQ/TnpB family protein n=1 Tax=unclassified Natronoarchaeum TaxID=2620183 RepID=UPI003614DA6D